MKAILTDTTLCTGCERCVAACSETHDLPEEIRFRWSMGDGLSGRRLTTVLHLPPNEFVRKQCRHCLEPACVAACPVGALRKTDEGAVVYDFHKCMGCRYCMMVCPFGIPRYEWESRIPRVRKCTLCASRLAEGKEPACTETCPTGATIFGERDELLAEAHRRIDADPDRYVDHVFGETEVGGTALLTISGIDLQALMLGNEAGERPYPELQEAAMNAVPVAFLSMGALMGGLHWIIERRNKLAIEGDEEQDG